jgi:hypothetical protein
MIERMREVRRRRQRIGKRRKLKNRLKKASPQERSGIEAKILKTYRLLTSLPQPAKPAATPGKKGS